ncbi:Tenascin-R [Holothuria leucospilota]|uniref:Tenascin-R n=1 Tax=Holothuria leucospilota TaxID=206669 RepID=A0A9Q1BF82_HOLLE|nr:Tenascin-R [Holothuria leucospilota]
MFYLTNQKMYELRIDLNNVNGEPYYAKYDLFRISDEGSKYRLVGLGEYDSNSTANFDAFASSRGHSFSTRDQENDVTPYRHCATHTDSAWWFGPGEGDLFCGNSVFNTRYNSGTYYKTVRWYNLPGNLYYIKYTEMKIRPLPVI